MASLSRQSNPMMGPLSTPFSRLFMSWRLFVYRLFHAYFWTFFLLFCMCSCNIFIEKSSNWICFFCCCCRFWGDINKLLISRMRSLFKVWSTLHFIPAGLLLSSPWPCCSQDNGGSYALIGWVTVTFSLTRAFNEECSLSLARPVRNIDLIFVHFFR